jgi:hypothetical protein
MKAKTIYGKSTAEIQSALSQSIEDGFKPTLAILFISIKQDRENICSMLIEKGISIFGSTTSGEFVSSDISEGGAVIMLLDLNPAYFKIIFKETAESSAYEISKQLGTYGRSCFKNPAFIIASGWLSIDGEQIIKGIEDGFGGEPTVFGGMAGDDLTLREPTVFSKDNSSSTGLVSIIIDSDKVEVNGIATCGWKPIGIAKTVTRSEGNIVYTIDDQPAFDLVIKYLGLEINSEPDADELINIGAYYPLQLERENATPVMRTAMWGNIKDRSLLCAGNVPQGSKVRFSLPPDFDIIDKVVSECKEVRDKHLQQTDAVLMFSCISRYLSFGVMTGEEIRMVKEVWNAPMAGFFSYGEYGKSKRGKHEFHNNTCCVVALKEK